MALTIISEFKIGKRKYSLAECPLCHKHFKVRNDVIKKTISCGCYWQRPGVSRRLQSIRNAMMMRCYNTNHKHYSRYGGSGIYVCDIWHNTKEFYKWSLENGYEDHLTLDRIDNNKGYFPANCRWVSTLEQGRNKRNCVTEDVARAIQSEPKRANLNNLSQKYGIPRSTLKSIKYKQNWKGL